MPVSGESGLILKMTGGSVNQLEREAPAVKSCGTARPGPSLIPGPPLALASTSACQAGKPGRIFQCKPPRLVPSKPQTRRHGAVVQANRRRFVTVPTTTAFAGEGIFRPEVARRSSNE